MNLLTIPETDRETQMQNVSNFDLGLLTSGRRDYNISQSISSYRYGGNLSIVPLNLRDNNKVLREEDELEEEKKDLEFEGNKTQNDSIQDFELPSTHMRNLNNFGAAPIVTDLETLDDYPPEPTGEGLLRDNHSNRRADKLSFQGNLGAIEELLQPHLNSNHNTPHHRRIQSLQVVPKPMYVTLGSPQGFEGDNEASIASSKNDVSESIKEPPKGLSSSQSMEQKCLVCFDKDPDAVFLECGHGGNC